MAKGSGDPEDARSDAIAVFSKEQGVRNLTEGVADDVWLAAAKASVYGQRGRWDNSFSIQSMSQNLDPIQTPLSGRTEHASREGNRESKKCQTGKCRCGTFDRTKAPCTWQTCFYVASKRPCEGDFTAG